MLARTRQRRQFAMHQISGFGCAGTSDVLNGSGGVPPNGALINAQTGKAILSANLTVASPSNISAVELGSPQNGATSAPGNTVGVQ